MPNNLIILSESSSFPWGMAASNRVRNLAKVLLKENWDVEYAGLRGADIPKDKKTKFSSIGKIDNIPFIYPGGFTVRSNSWWFRRIDDILGFFGIFIFFIFKKIKRKVECVIIYSRSTNVVKFWSHFLHLLNIPVILELCEWPLAIAETSGKGHKNASHFCEDVVPLVDAVLPISSYISHEVYRISLKKNVYIPSFQIPILIDNVYHTSRDSNFSSDKFLLYCGSIAYMDIAKIVVDIIYELKKRNIHIPIKFTGREDNARITELKLYAKNRGVLSLFEFTGFLDENDLFNLMRKATCLLAPLPENLQSQSRFPTKIGYYLASGTPILTNAVGDVKHYLKDKINAFIVENCDSRQFAAKIETILNDQELSKNVGLFGKDLAFEKFHYRCACLGLGEFLRQVVQNYRNS
ncbi:glycosyltransferase family 4 protein [uncultured Desulfosarcina sp.]|uniref:glycosyltransferase family 4 protein n=1 Tax=uncultured Desulfosarcina sp. TaxID=218289 RepID=UPI0029C6CFE4|nr:glycosyltransferase family 4 protein [uncultured Desulfosarcina sp.]